MTLWSVLLPGHGPALVLASVGNHIGFCGAVLVGMGLPVAMSLTAAVVPSPKPLGH